MTSLENVKPGDKLIVTTPYDEYVETVGRVTSTQVFTKLHRINRKTGKAQGYSKWHSVTAVPATEADIERIRSNDKRRELLRKCEAIKFNKLTEAQLEAVVKIVGS